tara:strand:- start:6690 stop:13106 length:6417 start_codon:yes stop_codon:yes gene_type:complete
MAESKFLYYQDKNRDGLIDVCEELIDVEETPACLPCSPNPNAIVDDWRAKTIDEPFLNEKTCEYQITVVTKHTRTINKAYLEAYVDDNLTEEEADAAMTERFDEYVDEAIKSLLEVYDKDDSDESIEAIKEVIDYTKYSLEPRPFSRLKLLYSVPFDDLAAIAAAESEEEDSDEDDEDAGVTVTYKASELKPLLIRVRKGLNLYNRYLKVYRAVEGGNIYVDDATAPMGTSESIPLVFALELYGDAGLFPNSLLGKTLVELDKFLAQKGYNWPGTGGLRGAFSDRVVKAEFKFSNEFKLKRLKIWTEECGEKSIVFREKLKPLLAMSSWKDSTAMAYFARLEDMDKDLQAREPKPWLEFIKEHTYPLVYDTTNPITANTDPENSVGSCVADALGEEMKQLGQDILDDVFSIGDAIAFKFHGNLCRASLGEVLDDEYNAGIMFGPSATGIVGENLEDTLEDLYAIAYEQAYQEVDQEASAFELMCVALIAMVGGSQLPGEVGSAVMGQGIDAAFESGKKGSSGVNVDALWSGGFDKIKLCGLFDLLMNAIECLMSGLSLEDALASMLKSALQSMGIEYFGDLFIGIPADKQAELDALVKEKIESGDIFKEGSSGQQISDTIEGKLEWTKPWEQQELVDKEKEDAKEGVGEGMTASEMQQTSELTHVTLSEQFDIGSESVQNQLSPNIVMEAYILALLEVYQDNYLDLLDELNKFPGAPIIAKIIALLDCPRPPIFNPSIMDFIKDFEIPWCGNIHDLTFPRLDNPFGWLPEIKDIMRFIWWAMRLILQQLIIKIIMKLIVKICSLIGDALCAALGVAGDLAAALPAMATGRTTFSDVIKASICGEDADQEQVDNTIVEMFASLGAGGTALANEEEVLSMAEDFAAATTQSELMNALLGDPSSDFLNIIDTIIEYEHPDFKEAFPNKDKIGNFFKNMGNLMPADFKDQMKDIADQIPPDEMLPVNPSLCATPEQIQQFKDLRSELLAPPGETPNATQPQIDQMFDDVQDKMLDDLDDLGSILQGGIPNYISNNMPPLVSDPGCDNGIVPYDSEEQKAAVSAALGGDMEQLKIAFSFDMLGNGPGRKKWGLINMILSDTMGMPLTAHQRKVFNRRRWVDFYVDTSDFDGADDEASFDGNVAKVKRQKGAYPEKVAEYLQEQLTALSTDFASSNDTLEDKTFSRSFEDLNITRFGKNIDLLSLPDFGYNFTTSVDYENEKVKFTQKARKKTADVTLSFADNAKGDTETSFSFGFDMEFFLSDIVENDDGVYVNRPDDNARVKITNSYNAAANLDFSVLEFMSNQQKKDFEKEAADAGIIYDRKFEFLTVDNTLDGIDLSDYTDFLKTFSEKSSQMPQIVLLREILNNNGASVSLSDMKSFHDEFMSSVLTTIATDVAENEAGFEYGAVFDDLSKEDLEYVTDDGVDYFDATNDDGDNLSNDDMVLGISRMQYEQGEDANRVFYLDPAQYGGSYMNPPLYIAPLANEGWLGFVDVMFPEISPCKPQRTDLIDFEDIQSRIDEVYPSLPEDERLKSDPDCIIEKPYERILERASAAAIEGLITAGIRMFVSVHFVKAIATFTKFYPKFTETYSSLFAQYIVEDMEKHFKSAQKAGWEFFNPFKDSEFWYGFLEQSVQTYARRVDSEGFTPPEDVYNALNVLSKVIKDYDYPYKKTGPDNLKEAKDLDEVSRFKTLKNYRSNKNLEAIQETEELAKLVLKELVNEQLNYMGEKFVDNLKIVGMKPDVFDLDYYVLENLTQGSELTLAEEIKEEVVSLPTEGEELYTDGSELSNTETGEMYTGYYHVTTDDEGDTVYMVGEFHTEDEHALLRPMADQVIVPIGDVQDYGTGGTDSTEQPFLIEKYISINGAKYSSDDAIDIIKGNTSSFLISDVYPGTLDLVTDTSGKVVGLTGELGVRYGLEYSIVMNGTAYPVTTVEVDALDTIIGVIPPFEGDSKLLLCLVNMLKNDDVYKLVAQYIFPMKKMTALVAIYNSEGFLPSIGETTVEAGAAFGPDGDDIDAKPGMKVSVDEDTGVATSEGAGSGWANIKDRSKRFTPFVLTWDEWDQILLRKSKSRLKKLFKTHYNSRDFDPGDAASDKPGKIILNSLRESFKFSPGMNLLPWWKRRMLRSNPFNSKGELCEKED